MNSTTVSCGNCGIALSEPSDLPTDRRVACARCGSVARSFAVPIYENLAIHEDLRVRARSPGEKKPFFDVKSGSDFWAERGKWMHRVQIVDRRNNRYRKLVSDPATGEAIRDVDEPLSDHRGYGAARRAGDSA